MNATVMLLLSEQPPTILVYVFRPAGNFAQVDAMKVSCVSPGDGVAFGSVTLYQPAYSVRRLAVVVLLCQVGGFALAVIAACCIWSKGCSLGAAGDLQQAFLCCMICCRRCYCGNPLHRRTW
jgi:hypothetical protein